MNKETNASKLLSRYGVDRDRFGKVVEGYLGDEATYEPDLDSAIATLIADSFNYRTFRITLPEHDDFGFIAKILKQNVIAHGYSGRPTKKYAHKDEAAILREMPEDLDNRPAPLLLDVSKNVMFLEDIGTYEDNSIESRLIRNNVGEKLLRKILDAHLVYNHYTEKIQRQRIPRLNKKRLRQRFRNYLKGVLLWKNNGRLDPSFELLSREFMDSAKPLIDIISNCSITGEQDKHGFRTVLHSDLHFRHIYETNGVIKFIDPKPKEGPIQIDLVDFLYHPETLLLSERSAIKNYSGKKVSINNLVREFIAKRLIRKMDSLGAKIDKKDREGLLQDTYRNTAEDFFGVLISADIIRSIRGAAKSSWLEVKNNEQSRKVLDYWTSTNPRYPRYKDIYLAHLGHQLESFLSLIEDPTDSGIHLPSEDVEKIEKFHLLAMDHFELYRYDGKTLEEILNGNMNDCDCGDYNEPERIAV